ncbi:ATP synthase gamma chain family protein [Salix suchowensis]|nr:ATP synthase gamma chain family protein [Salix suchowensis]
MNFINLTTLVSSKSSLSSTSLLSLHSSTNPFQLPRSSSRFSHVTPIHCGLREIRNRLNSVKNTQKITEAMKLVSAAKVRRAQEAVVNGRPFSETLVEVLYNINEQLQNEDIDMPLTNIRPVKKVALVVITGDRGLCGGFNNNITKMAEARIAELKNQGVEYTVISVGKKGRSYFIRRPHIPVDRFLEGMGFPTAKEAQTIADNVFSLFVSEEVDKVELLYTKFVSLVKFVPVIQTLLPLSPKGRICDMNGVSVDADGDEFFRLTSKEGKLALERDAVRTEKAELSPIMQFEQDPVQILDALLPFYNRERQAKITGELLEIIAGADALTHEFIMLVPTQLCFSPQ